MLNIFPYKYSSLSPTAAITFSKTKERQCFVIYRGTKSIIHLRCRRRMNKMRRKY